MSPGKLCPSCLRGASAGRRPGQEHASLSLCESCGGVWEGKRLPPALADVRGRVLCTDPTLPDGAAILIQEENVVLTYWTGSVIRGASMTLTRAEFKRRMGY